MKRKDISSLQPYKARRLLRNNQQRWSPRGRPWPRGRPRGQILKSLALALASRPQVLENWPVLGSRTARFFGMLKFCGALEKFFGKRFLVKTAWKIFVKTFFWKIFVKTFFFGEHLRFVSLVLGLGLEHSCPWPRECLSSERLSLALALASSLVSSTPPLITKVVKMTTLVRKIVKHPSVKNKHCEKVVFP